MQYTKLSRIKKAWNRILIGFLLFPVFMGFAVPGEGGAEGGEGGEGGGSEGGEGGKEGGEEGGEGGKSTEDIAAEAETARRAALSDEERTAEDQKKADDEKAAAGAPEEYEAFTVPEKMEMDAAVLDEFKPLLKNELNLSQEKAQKLIDFYTQKVIPSFAARGVDVWNKDVQSRVDAITADKEIGGDNLAKTTETVNRVANTFLSAEESEELKSYSARFGDCPAFLKILTRVGAAMREDKVIIPGAGGDTGELSLADRLYGKK